MHKQNVPTHIKNTSVMNKNTRSKIESSLITSSQEFWHLDEKIYIRRTRDYDLAKDVVAIENLTKAIIASDEMVFQIAQPLSKSRFSMRPENMRQQILNLLEESSIFRLEDNGIHRSNPYVDLFVRQAKNYKLHEIPLQDLSENEEFYWIANLNAFVRSIRVLGQGQPFKKSIGDHQRLSNKNYAGLIKYIDSLFNVRSRLMVIRLDIGMSRKACWNEDGRKMADYEKIKRFKNELFVYLKKQFTEEVFVGFAWKLEYGLEKTYHYHLLLFFNGRLVREDVTIGKIIGEYWRNEITKGEGIYYNCNAHKENYVKCGVGIINHGDFDLRENLKTVASYLTKTDYFIKMAAPGGDPVFRRGNVLKSPESKVGRPRNIDPNPK
jgi:hypothetical protein